MFLIVSTARKAILYKKEYCSKIKFKNHKPTTYELWENLYSLCPPGHYYYFIDTSFISIGSEV